MTPAPERDAAPLSETLRSERMGYALVQMGRDPTGMCEVRDDGGGDTVMTRLGFGLTWRPEIDDTIERLSELDFVEVHADDLDPSHLPGSLLALRRQGVPVIPHSESLSLGGTRPPPATRLAHLAACAEALESPLLSDHLAVVSANGRGHRLLPVVPTPAALDVIAENVQVAQERLPVPLALENIADTAVHQAGVVPEAEFLTELVRRTGVRLLADIGNLHARHLNFGQDPYETLDTLPLEAVAYVHVGGGQLVDGAWQSTHTRPVTPEALDVLAGLCARADPVGVLLERDGDYPGATELADELRRVRAVVEAARV